MQGSATAHRMLYIPPDLRGAARAICDADPTQFPELYERPTRPGTAVGTDSGGARSHESSRSRSTVPDAAALQQLMTEVNDGVPLTATEFRLFRVAYAECRQHLRGVPAGLVGAGTPLSDVLTLTTKIDSLCTELSITLTETFPQLKEVHTFALMLADREGGGTVSSGLPSSTSATTTSGTGDAQTALQRLGGGEQALLQSVMLGFLGKILQRGVDALVDFREQQRQQKEPRRRRAARRPHAFKGDGATAAGPRCGSIVPYGTQRRRAGVPEMPPGGQEGADPPQRSATTPHVALFSPVFTTPLSTDAVADGGDGAEEDADDSDEATSIEGAGEDEVWQEGEKVMVGLADTAQAAATDQPLAGPRQSLVPAVGGDAATNRVGDAISSVNADLRCHLAHLRWLVELTSSGNYAYFNADDYLDDTSMRKMWATYVGNARPACTAEAFAASGLITLFPAWLHGPMMAVLNPKDCGVVSVFTVQRLLRVWGPLLLLDRNLQDDVRSGVLCLREPAAYIEQTLALKPDAQVGDFAVALTETPGEVRLTVLRAATAPAGMARLGGGLSPSAPLLQLGYPRSRFSAFFSSNDSPPSAAVVAGLLRGSTHPPAPHVSAAAAAAMMGGHALPDVGGVAAGTRVSRRRSRWMSMASFYCDQQRLQGRYLQPSGVKEANSASSFLPPLVAGRSDGEGTGTHARRHSLSQSSMSAGALAPAAPEPLRAVSYRLTQDTGAWTVQGLTKEEFESIAEVCRAFPDVFRRARGETWREGGMGVEADSAAAAPATDSHARFSDSFARLQRQQQQERLQRDGGAANSALHRACFRNNTRYVRTLLTRGAGTVVNTAVIDPAVTEHFCWTPLLCAANNPNADPVEMVALLLDAGADATYQDDAACTALYYAIANGYAATARLLLAHCPALTTSPETVPLMMALGAHPYLPCERDIRRLTDVVPSAAMMEALCAHVDDYKLCSLAVRILLAKLNGWGIDGPTPSESDADDETDPGEPPRHATGLMERDTAVLRQVVMRHCSVGPSFEELHTTEEETMLNRLIHCHDQLCRTYAHVTRRAIAVLCARCYLLSWRDWLAVPSHAGGSRATLDGAQDDDAHLANRL